MHMPSIQHFRWMLNCWLGSQLATSQYIVPEAKGTTV
jgi:hypothetical protein